MSRAKVSRYFDLARKIAVSKDTKRSFIVGAIAIRSDGVIVGSPNACTQYPDRRLHAEYKTMKKADANSVVFVARILRSNSEFAMARPCEDCFKILKSKRVEKVYYTINEKQYGVLTIVTDHDTIHQF
jgi:tRNA(Arg) A34 adenosine deaminase TadA